MENNEIAPEGVINDFFDDIIANFIKSHITSGAVKKLVFMLIDNAEEVIKATNNKIDDYFLGLVKRELETNWDRWFSWLAVRLGLVAVPQSVESLEEETYTVSGVMVPQDETLAPETTVPELGLETILLVLELVLPYIVKWLKKD